MFIFGAMLATDAYQHLKTTSEGFFKDRGSKFYAHAIPCQNDIDAKAYIDQFRKDNPNACHVCFAWRFGEIEQQYKDRFSDDGEPSNSAGKPIFGQIQSFGLTNILIAVVRYYGGTNLGVGGLITAYKTASKSALEKAEIVTSFVTNSFELLFSYEDMGLVMNLLKKNDITQIKQEFEGSLAKLIIKVRQSKSEQFSKEMTQIHTVKFKLLI